ncbi:phosphotransferase [Nocardia sp. SYP-A9097]|uniref:phosphotransferase family protein n=1 Tax=Nocardia sp. SYP-A9097 TaxID=2663237 RepID=UPI00129B0A95|nr:phosphotransferase family protein [Nocardia sp. SYP-A9097]MRH90011.1 phosphotransferase [Nocardia sp. SYP-A9097]
MTSADPNQRWEMTTSERDLDALTADLTRWLASKVDADTPPDIVSLTRPAGGMSSTTLLFDAEWTVSGEPMSDSFVARIAPEDSSFPVFEKYDLATQYAVIAGVAAATEVPLPQLCWLENDETVLGSPFFVMRRANGRVPEDNPPYVFLGWIFDATLAERAAMTRNIVDVISAVHAIENPDEKFPMLAGEGSALRRHFEAQKAWYEWALAGDGIRIPLLERTFDHLEANWPTETGPDVLTWGDARPGNIIFDGFDPVAVLDWEMAAIGPRELDIAWLIHFHRFFQDIAVRFDQPGLPDYLRRGDVERLYEEFSGYTPQQMDWHLTYAALRNGIVMARIKRRAIHFGEDIRPTDPDDYVLHRPMLEALLDDAYDWE